MIAIQTFLPFPDFTQSAQTLDRQRLGKQRVETLQIMQALMGYRLVTKGRKRIDRKLQTVELPQNKWTFEQGVGQGWINHPAVLMWQQTPRALLEYQYAVCKVWKALGYVDTCSLKTEMVLYEFRKCSGRPLRPSWLGNEQFHLSHRSNLIRKDSGHYLPIFGPIPAMEYVWPTHSSQQRDSSTSSSTAADESAS